MLVRFRVKNYKSFREEAVLDMRAVAAYKEHPEHLIAVEGKEDLLKSAVIYGANAGGKSNFWRAMQSFRHLMRETGNATPEGEPTVLEKEYMPFAFDETDDEGTEMEMTCQSPSGIMYTYGFVYNDKRIESEWFYRQLPGAGAAVLFEREGDKYEFGIHTKKQLEKKIEDQVPSDVLMYTYLAKMNEKALNDVIVESLFNINTVLMVNCSIDYLQQFVMREMPDWLDNQPAKQELLKFLGAVDVGIRDIFVEEDLDGKKKLFTKHIGRDGGEYVLGYHEESSGTRKAVGLFYWVSRLLDIGYTIIVDEFNAQLHPLLGKYMQDLFYENEYSQLIITSHDPTFLDNRYVRRDEVWFVEKNEYGESELFSLADFKLRQDASLGKAYLGGAFGGIPMLRDMEAE